MTSIANYYPEPRRLVDASYLSSAESVTSRRRFARQFTSDVAFRLGYARHRAVHYALDEDWGRAEAAEAHPFESWKAIANRPGALTQKRPYNDLGFGLGQCELIVTE